MAPGCKFVNGKQVNDGKGKPVMENCIRNKGRANPKFLIRNKLTKNSHPAEWFSALLPDKKGPTDSKHAITIGDWTLYIYSKALIANVGQEGGVYPEYKPFSPKRIKQYLE